jgi:hypothetical protein
MTPKIVTFILSSDYSGSNWVGYVLGSGQHSAFLGEFWRAWSSEFRQPCSWCAAHGHAVCDVLDGVEKYPEREAMETAFSRIGKPFLVDSSKRKKWAELFVIPNSRYEVRLIHLIRDPRGFVTSWRRRGRDDLRRLAAEWLDENLRLREFLQAGAAKSTTVFYEDLAESPLTNFAELCSFIGFPFEPAALRYWEKAHHGFAANGASSPLLYKAPHSSALEYFVTGDDSYYRERGQTTFVDQRWKHQLSPSEGLAIVEHPALADFLKLYDRALSPGGLLTLSASKAETVPNSMVSDTHRRAATG